MEGNFMKGLEPEVRTAVRVLEPRNLGKAMELAQLVEDQKKSKRETRGNYSGGSYRTTTTLLAPKGPALGNINETTREKPVGGWSGKNFKRLTEKEMQEKRAKGLCFRCDEKYMLGHRCKDRTLQVLLVCEDKKDEGGGSISEEEDEKLHLDVAEVSELCSGIHSESHYESEMRDS
ncbi:hypothetical protein KFK09_005661 [Dendrobium nobile]|uniref:Retrotransposon protein n=1 Tax=Dendrobium nobile TaxID=94219 RepID=A0A8T3BWF8_DENNO|nr:hypothetical protein KFK09_005661 [Dendrobium nobile]